MKTKAPRNRTIELSEDEKFEYKEQLMSVFANVSIDEIIDKIVNQDVFEALEFLPSSSFDLVFADPPYNMTKKFNLVSTKKMSQDDYENWLELWISKMSRLLKKNGAIYICGDWESSSAILRVLQRYFIVRNRITWEREKGRGSKSNWKNNCEDIWFATKSDDYTFNVDAVKLKKNVIAPYTNSEGEPKDWLDTGEGRFRLTHPSNIWTDITIPFWSMLENTDHPTQKPEKLLAKIILASTNEGDIVFDPFLGSGTTSVVSRKLNRHYVGIEIDVDYCCIAEKRLEIAKADTGIQGYSDGVFWERNSLIRNKKNDIPGYKNESSECLFKDVAVKDK